MNTPPARSTAARTVQLMIGWIAAAAYLSIVVFWMWSGLARAAPRELPGALGLLVTPTSAWPISVLSAAAVVMFLTLGATPRSRPIRGTIAVGVLLVSAGLVAFATYLPCSGQESPFWTAVRRALDLARGELNEPFASGGSCEGAVPLGLQAAELMMVVAFALVAYRAVGLVFTRQFERLRAARARHISIFAGLDLESVAFARALLRSVPQHVLPVVVHAVGDASARSAAAALGGVAIALDVSDPDEVQRFIAARSRRSIRGIHLLQADSTVALAALTSFRTALLRGTTTVIPSRLQVRIDDPWHADDWRRRNMANTEGWLVDAVSTVETAARLVVDELLACSIEVIVLTGASQFELSVLSELALRHRARLAVTGEVQPSIRLLAVGEDAERAAEHLEHQVRRFGIDTSGLGRPARARSLDHAMDTRRRAALLIDPSTTAVTEATNASFLAARRPTWRIYAWSGRPSAVGIDPTIGGLRLVHPTLDPALGGTDIWERFGRLSHERYLALYFDGDPVVGHPARGRWDEDLTPFNRETNVRSFAAIAGSMTRIGKRWATTLDGERRDTVIDLTDEEIETLAIAEHESWRRHREEHGWRYAKARNDARRRHPLMVGWDVLSDDEREKDRSTVRGTVALLLALGFTMEGNEARPDGASR